MRCSSSVCRSLLALPAPPHVFGLQGARQRRAFLAQRQAAITLQSASRGWQERRRLQQQQAAALALQCAWRRRCAAQQLGVMRAAAAATAIQAVFRGRQVRLNE